MRCAPSRQRPASSTQSTLVVELGVGTGVILLGQCSVRCVHDSCPDKGPKLFDFRVLQIWPLFTSSLPNFHAFCRILVYCSREGLCVQDRCTQSVRPLVSLFRRTWIHSKRVGPHVSTEHKLNQFSHVACAVVAGDFPKSFASLRFSILPLPPHLLNLTTKVERVLTSVFVCPGLLQ